MRATRLAYEQLEGDDHCITQVFLGGLPAPGERTWFGPKLVAVLGSHALDSLGPARATPGGGVELDLWPEIWRVSYDEVCRLRVAARALLRARGLYSSPNRWGVIVRGANWTQPSWGTFDKRREHDNFSDFRCSGSSFRAAHLEGSNFTRAMMMECNLDQARLDGSIMRGAVFTSCYFEGASLADVDLVGAELDSSVFKTGSLARTNLMGASACAVNFRDADLRGARFDKVRLDESDLRGALLAGATFAGASMVGVKLDPGVVLR